MIRNMVFDMGGVLINYDPRHFIEREGIRGGDAELLLKVIFGSVEWSLLDWGEKTEDEVEPIMLAQLPERLHVPAKKLLHGWNVPTEPTPGMAALIRDCKARSMGIYLLSNASVRLPGYFHTLPASECFDGRIVSALEKCVKPMPEIYRALLNRYRLKAEECLFVDDVPINVAGAMRCGMQGFLFNSNVDDLRKRIGI